MGRELIYQWPLSRRGGLFSLSPARPWAYPALAILSNSYSRLKGRLFTCYSPVRRSFPKKRARLACVRHAASVHSEPGSNSPIEIGKYVHMSEDMFYLALFIHGKVQPTQLWELKILIGLIGFSQTSLSCYSVFKDRNASNLLSLGKWFLSRTFCLSDFFSRERDGFYPNPFLLSTSFSRNIEMPAFQRKIGLSSPWK